MDEDVSTVGDRFRCHDIGKGSGDIKSTIRDIIDADRALLETDPEAFFFDHVEARLRAAFERLSGGSDTRPPYWWPWCWKHLTHYCATG